MTITIILFLSHSHFRRTEWWLFSWFLMCNWCIDTRWSTKSLSGWKILFERYTKRNALSRRNYAPTQGWGKWRRLLPVWPRILLFGVGSLRTDRWMWPRIFLSWLRENDSEQAIAICMSRGSLLRERNFATAWVSARAISKFNWPVVLHWLPRRYLFVYYLVGKENPSSAKRFFGKRYLSPRQKFFTFCNNLVIFFDTH